MKNEAIREELQVFNLNEKLKDYKTTVEKHLARMSDSRVVNKSGSTKLQEAGDWGVSGWRIFEGGEGIDFTKFNFTKFKSIDFYNIILKQNLRKI